ncbi:chemotaxis protein CheW [Paenibacillus sp. NFR01]|uniref:chemotaxis protein CheW n=1 Tax=Paenibacillus sp. NFR01 TaxID=1566279 RepID=UPI0008C71203|nr:chemotaxis protein CheW [Paenibacillus sp. NFR01]SEU23547.1 purine-binding chemotaxis protein CheW [Paenibacillus sp. NFR01]
MVASASEQYIVSRLGGDRHAFNIRDIEEIIKMEHITDVPNTKPYIKGVINLRGRIVPVVSMCQRIGIPETPAGRSARIIVARHQNEVTGIIVDAVEKVTSFQEIQPPLESGETLGLQYMDGIGNGPDGLVGILNIHRLLTEG